MEHTRITGLSRKPSAGRPFLLVLFFAIELFIILFFVNEYRRQDNIFTTQSMQTLDASYRGATIAYDQTTQMIFEDEVNKPEVLRLIALAFDDRGKRDALRDELYRLMLPSYEKQKTIGIWQVHFHLKDGTSFLRMHAPKKFGDNLFRRPAVKRVNTEQKHVTGYEVGYFADGYRYMYPLFFNGRHIGSVEFVITSQGIIHYMDQIYCGRYHFIIDRLTVDEMTYEDWKKMNFKECNLSDRFVVVNRETEDATITAINQKLKNRVSKRLAGMEQFWEKVRSGSKDYLINFLPIKDVTGRPVAYFVQYNDDQYSGHSFRLASINIALFTLLLAGIFYAIDNIQTKRQSMEQKHIALEQLSKTLHESEERFKALTESTSDWIWEVNENGIYTYSSPKLKDLLGYEPEEVVGKTPFDFMPQEEARRIANDFSNIVKARRNIINVENINLHKDGRLVVLETSGVPIFDSKGHFRGYRGIDRDITERKKMQDSLLESERLYRTLFEQSVDAIFLIEADGPEQGSIIAANQCALSMHGFSLEEMLQCNISDLDVPEDAARVKERIQLIKNGGVQFEAAHQRKDGSTFPVEVNARCVLLGGRNYILAIDRDITERKKAENALKESEERYRILIETIPDVTRISDKNGHTTFISPNLEKVYGYKPEEVYLSGDSLWFGRIHPDDVHKVKEAYNALFETKTFNIEYRIRRKDGEWIWVHDRAMMVYETDGNEFGYGIFSDISIRKKAEEALRESEERHRTLFDGAPDAIFLADPETGVIIDANKAASRLVNRALSEIIGMHQSQLHPPRALDHSKESFRTHVDMASRGIPVLPIENSVLCSDGTEVPVDVMAQMVSVNGRRLLQGVFRDITVRKKMQDALKENEGRLRAITGNIADTIIQSDRDGRIIYVNRLEHGITYEQIAGSTVFNFVPAENVPIVRSTLDAVFERGETRTYESLGPGPGGTWNVYSVRVSPIMIDGIVNSAVFLARDITERKKAEEHMRESHERLLTVLNGIDAIVYVADIKTYELLFVNNYLRKIFGDVEGKTCWKILQTGQTAPCPFCTNDKLLDADGRPSGIYRWEFQNTVNGHWYDIRDRAMQWIDGRIVRLEIATDITERKLAEARIKKALLEKEILLREIHHRVKNNMQVITSLLRLQAQKIQDNDLKKPFEESEQRIRAMAMVHERLYQKENLSEIHLGDYIRNIVRELKAVYSIDVRKVAVSINVADIMLGIDTAIPCVLIINELITNCFKYAFPEGRSGEVVINFTKEDHTYNLTIRDNGVGLPAGFDFRQTATLGMQIVNVLTKQLMGTFHIRSDGGTEAFVTFTQKKRMKGKEENTDS